MTVYTSQLYNFMYYLVVILSFTKQWSRELYHFLDFGHLRHFVGMKIAGTLSLSWLLCKLVYMFRKNKYIIVYSTPSLSFLTLLIYIKQFTWLLTHSYPVITIPPNNTVLVGFSKSSPFSTRTFATEILVPAFNVADSVGIGANSIT